MSHESRARARRIQPRLVGLLASLFVLVCALVIATDFLSPRDRAFDQPKALAPASLPASFPAPATAPL
jgi:hypothetical protein